jgi:hypothetical protein
MWSAYKRVKVAKKYEDMVKPSSSFNLQPIYSTIVEIKSQDMAH